MHFTKEKNLLHFIYVLPFSHNKALLSQQFFQKKFSEKIGIEKNK